MNSIDTSRVVLWQYDGAETFVNFLEAREDVANMAVGDVWNRYYSSVFNISSCDEFGLWMWGNILGISRPLISVESGGSITHRAVSDEVFRKILIARFYWMNANPSMATMARYYSILLNCGEGSEYPYRKVVIEDNYDMTMSLSLNWLPDEEVQAVLQSEDIVNHPTGVKVAVNFPADTEYLGFNGYWSSGNEATRVGLQVTEKDYWGYEDEGMTIVPNDPYYTETGDELRYDFLENEYYAVEEGERVVYGKDDDHPMYDSSDVATRHKLSIIAPDSFYLTTSNNGMVIVASPYDDEGHLLSRDSGGWYYMDGSKKYYYGQSLSNFDNAVFKPEE